MLRPPALSFSFLAAWLSYACGLLYMEEPDYGFLRTLIGAHSQTQEAVDAIVACAGVHVGPCRVAVNSALSSNRHQGRLVSSPASPSEDHLMAAAGGLMQVCMLLFG